MRTRNLLLGVLLGVCFLVGLAATTSTLHTPLVCPEGITCTDATKVPLIVSGGSGHTNWLGLFQNGGTNYMSVDKKGNIGIGLTNIFANKSIGITRVYYVEGSGDKAWINIGGLDTWPNYNHASEWWANTGTNDGVMDLTWLSSTAIAPTKDFVWSVGAADGSTYFRYKYDGTNRFELDVGANLTTIGSLITTPSALQSKAAGSAVLANASKIRVEGSGGAVTLTAAPTIADGSNGQQLVIQGTSDSNTLTFQDQGTLASSNLELGAATRQLGAGDILILTFDTSASVWYEMSFTNN